VSTIQYGRPLFAKAILNRVMLGASLAEFEGDQKVEFWISVHATRVQMSSTKLDVISQLVAEGYANLTGVTRNFAPFVFMPDPVCARLAMCMVN
jgi:hypothetical protein